MSDSPRSGTFSFATFGRGRSAVEVKVIWFDARCPSRRIPAPQTEITPGSPLADPWSTPLSIGSACNFAKFLTHAKGEESHHELIGNLLNAISWANQEQRYVFEMERTQ